MSEKPPEPGKDSPDGVWSQDTHIGAPRSLPGLNAGDGITLESAGKKALPEGQQVTDEVADRRSVKELLDKGGSAQERYVVDREIARGGMGAILRAVDGDIRREVALKVMLSQDAAKRPRFIEEAQITGQLEHPNIVPVHELSVDAEGRVFFTMKLVRGRSLEDVLKRMRKQPHSGDRKYSLVRLLNVVVNVCHAMAFAHSKGVIHRDLKPSNVMLGDFGEVLVMDWGLAKVLGRPEEAEPGHVQQARPLPGAVTESGQVRTSRQESGTDATLDGSVIGTPVYMPPEQAEGRVGEVDERSDVYALGAMLYEILTLQPPVETRGGALVVIGRVSRGEVIAPERRAPDRAQEGKIPKELSAIAMKALSLKMEDRYGSVEEFRRDIELYLEGRAVSAKEDTFAESIVKLVKRNKGVSVAAAVGMLAVMIVVGVGYWLNLQERQRAEEEADKARLARDEATRAREEAERQRDKATRAYEDLKAARQAQEKAEEAKKTLEDKAAAESRREWHLVFDESFAIPRILERAPLEADLRTADPGTEGELAPETPAALARRWVESRWEIVGGTWELKNGELRLLASGQAWMLLKKPMPGDVRVEFDCHEESGYLNDISCFMNAQPRDKWPSKTSQAPGYHFKYGGWFNSRNALEFGTRTIFTQDAKPVVRGKTYHVRAERMGRRLVLTVDDKVIYDVEDPQPPDLGPEHAVAGLYASGTESWFNNIKVYNLGSPRKIDILDLAEDYSRKGNCRTAQDLFQDVLDSDSDPARLEQARDGKARAFGTLELPGYRATLEKAWPDVKFSLEMKAHGLLLDISKTAVSDLSVLTGMKLAALNLDGSKVTDLSPLKGMPLASLNCANLKLKGLEALSGLKLRKLECQTNQVKSLEPLRGMPLTWLNCSANSITTLEPLRGMSLARLECQGNQIKGLEPLHGMPLTWLNCGSNKVTSLEPLRGVPLARLECQDDPITELEPLRGTPLSSLNLGRTKVADVSWLREVPLKSIDLSYTPERDAAALRSLKTLETINGVPVTEFWASDTSSQVRCFDSPGSWFVGSVFFLPDGKRILSGHADSTLKLWNAETGALIRTFKGHTTYVMGAALSSDGKRAFSTDAGKTWRLWDVETGKEIRRVEKLLNRANGVALSPDGKQALVTSEGKDVLLWDVDTGQEVRHFDGHTKQTFDVAFSPDGKTVYSTSEDGTLRSWDRETGAQLKRFDAKTPVHAVVITRDGKQALISCTDGSLRLLDLGKNAEIRRFSGHSKPAWGVALSPDGKRVLSGSDDTSLRLWDLETGKQLRRFHRHNGGVTGVAFSPDGRQAASASVDSTVRLWTMPAPDADEPAKAR